MRAGVFKKAPGILGGRTRIGRSPEITGTRRGRCAARKVELTGGAARSVAEQASAGGRARCWRGRVRAERALRGVGLRCCWAVRGGVARARAEEVACGLGRQGRKGRPNWAAGKGLGRCWVDFGCGFVFYFSLSISFLF